MHPLVRDLYKRFMIVRTDEGMGAMENSACAADGTHLIGMHLFSLSRSVATILSASLVRVLM